MVERYDWSRIANYVAGGCSDEEKLAFEAELVADQDLREAVEEVRRIWAGAELNEPELAEWDLAATWQQFVRGRAIGPALEIVPIVATPHRATPTPRPRSRERPRWASIGTWMAGAAAAAIVVGAALWFRAEANLRATAGPFAEASMYMVATRPGQRLDLRMSDGSRIVLGAASTLRYPKIYGNKRRDVYLEGHAYFEVTHDETRPFVVYAGRAVARDLGTRFDVRAYKNDGRIDVVVAGGKVELTNGTNSREARAGAQKRLVLAAGQIGSVNTDGTVTSRPAADLSQYVAWIEGRLVFKDAALREVLPELSRWYDVKIELTDPTLGARRFTGTFADESLPEVLQFLTLSVGASYQRDGDTITLTPNR